MLSSGVNVDFSFFMYLLAIFVLFAGLSVLETSTNSYVLAIGPRKYRDTPFESVSRPSIRSERLREW
ncbi:hypothetical protein NIB75_04075 [Bacteroides uniformis]|nr:hypothetical protein [Bacteroides uniformis]